MKLFINDSSPYSRLVRIVALEKGLCETVSLVWSNPWADDERLLEHNPAGRIPVLLTHDGVAITESLLIAQYLDSLSSLSSLQPAGDLCCVQLVGLGLGLMEAAFTHVVSEKFEGAQMRDSFFGRRREQAIARTCEAFTLGEIVIGVALSYLAFRAPLNDWQSRFLSLRDLHERLSVRSSFQMTPFK
jgi:glutathione S-transferase